MPKKVAEPETGVKPTPKPSKPDTGRLIRLCAAAWLVPGAGHYLLGHKWRALVLFLAIVIMFVFGLVMKGQFFSVASASYLETLGYFGELCVGLPMPVSSFFGYSGGDPFFASADFGTAFLVSAGMLNVLAILDAYDIALGRKP
jgi:Family of unknown function (DUF6677)